MDWNYHSLPEHPCPICDHEISNFEVTRYDKGKVVSCEKCGHYHLNPRPSQAMLDSLAQNIHTNADTDLLMQELKEWHDFPGSVYQFAHTFMQGLGSLKGKKVVEVGCGPGLVLNECKKRGADVIGVDCAPASRDLAKKYFGVDVIQEPLENLLNTKALPAERFDFFLAFELIEHLQRPQVLVDAANHLLKPNGFLILSTPNFELYHQLGSHAPALHAIVDHIQFFDKKALKNLLGRAGFEIDTITSLQPLSAADRQKKILGRTPVTNQLWRAVRQIPLAKQAKNYFFAKIDQAEKKKVPPKEDPLRGLALICCAKKTSNA